AEEAPLLAEPLALPVSEGAGWRGGPAGAGQDQEGSSQTRNGQAHGRPPRGGDNDQHSRPRPPTPPPARPTPGDVAFHPPRRNNVNRKDTAPTGKAFPHDQLPRQPRHAAGRRPGLHPLPPRRRRPGPPAGRTPPLLAQGAAREPPPLRGRPDRPARRHR